MTSTISLHPPPKFNTTQTSVHTINETTCTIVSKCSLLLSVQNTKQEVFF